MRAGVKLFLLAMILVVSSGVVVAFMAKARYAAACIQCMNNLRSLGLDFENYHHFHHHFPAGTIANQALPPDLRLSWCADIAPLTQQCGPECNRTRAWD